MCTLRFVVQVSLVFADVFPLAAPQRDAGWCIERKGWLVRDYGADMIDPAMCPLIFTVYEYNRTRAKILHFKNICFVKTISEVRPESGLEGRNKDSWVHTFRC